MKKIIFFFTVGLLFLYGCRRNDVFEKNTSNIQNIEKEASIPVDLGTVAPVSEGRGLIAHRTLDGKPIIITIAMDILNGRTRNSLLIIDAKTGKTDQYWHPFDGPNGENTVPRENYSSMLASNGKLYTMFGDVFLEFDLALRKWTYNKKIEGRAMSFAESQTGNIFFANYPQSTLYSFNPDTKNLVSYGRLDNVEQYPYSLAVGKDGWVYAGIGTARSNLVAYHISSGERRTLMKENERQIGEGYVFLGQDDVIYATHLKNQKSPLFRLENGQKNQVIPNPSVLPKKAITGFVFWQDRINDFPGGGKVQEFVLREKYGKIIDERGKSFDISIDYKTSGAAITSFTFGPDAAIWGSTSHPIRLWRYEPKSGYIGDWKGMKEISGANFPNLITLGQKIYGALYNGGMIWSFDVLRPWNSSNNPLLMGAFNEIARPRAVTVTSDKENIVFGGYPGYGYTGGDLVFVDVINEKANLVKVQDQLAGLSTIVLRSLPEGLLVGGTSIAAPGGGTPTATKAVLYLMNEDSRKIIFQIIPVLSGADIESLEVKNGLVYGITSDSQFFVFDPVLRQVIAQQDIKSYGSPIGPGQSFALIDDGYIYCVMSKAIFRVDSHFNIIKLTDLPQVASAGIGFYNDILYYACGANLWSYKVK